MLLDNKYNYPSKYESELDFFGINKDNINLYNPEKFIINKIENFIKSGDLKGPRGYNGKDGNTGRPGRDWRDGNS